MAIRWICAVCTCAQARRAVEPHRRTCILFTQYWTSYWAQFLFIFGSLNNRCTIFSFSTTFEIYISIWKKKSESSECIQCENVMNIEHNTDLSSRMHQVFCCRKVRSHWCNEQLLSGDAFSPHLPFVLCFDSFRIHTDRGRVLHTKSGRSKSQKQERKSRWQMSLWMNALGVIIYSFRPTNCLCSCGFLIYCLYLFGQIISHCLEDVDHAFIKITDVISIFSNANSSLCLRTEHCDQQGNFRVFSNLRFFSRKTIVICNLEWATEKRRAKKCGAQTDATSANLLRTHYPFDGSVQSVRCNSLQRFTLTMPSIMNAMYHSTLVGLVWISARMLCSMQLS